MCVSIIYVDIYLSPLHNIGGVYKLGSGMSHITTHCSHTNTMPREGSSSSTWVKKSKTKQKKQKSLQKKQNQRCPGCLNKSCPKKFNNNEDKCGKL